MTSPELFPQLDPREAERTFEPLFRACRELLALAWARKPVSSDEPGRLLVLGIFARATLTYQAVMHLCRGGYGEQGDMLNRSLFEDMAGAHWASLNPGDAVERMGKHHDHTRVLWNAMLERQTLLDKPIALGISDEYVQELESLFGRHGERSWTGLSMHALVEEIQQLWPDDEGRAQLWRFYELAHRVNNQKLHLSSFALNRTVQVEGDGGSKNLRFRSSPSIDSQGPVGPALFGAFWIYWQLVGLVFDLWAIPQDELTALVDGHMPSFAAASELFTRNWAADG